jgi:hypothetical protein
MPSKLTSEIVLKSSGSKAPKILEFKILGQVSIKGIVSPDWKGLQMVSLDRFEV